MPSEKATRNQLKWNGTNNLYVRPAFSTRPLAAFVQERANDLE